MAGLDLGEDIFHHPRVREEANLNRDLGSNRPSRTDFLPEARGWPGPAFFFAGAGSVRFLAISGAFRSPAPVIFPPAFKAAGNAGALRRFLFAGIISVDILVRRFL
jgi:hypothetical protein